MPATARSTVLGLRMVANRVGQVAVPDERLDTLAKALLEYETLSGDEVKALPK